jgi:hypothetical protein
MSVRQCFIWLFYMQRRGISKKPSEQGGTHDLVDVPDRHCSHCRVRVGFLEEQEMMTVYYIYRFKRRCGLPRIHALKQAIQSVLRP